MILVITGSHYIPFDRLLRHMRVWMQYHRDEDVVIQAGESKINVPRATIFPYIDHDGLVDLMKKARLVVCHAGPATIKEILTYSSFQPIVVPRRKKYSEHVSDHQWYFVLSLEKRHIVTVVRSEKDLNNQIAHPIQIQTRNLGDCQQECLQKIRSYVLSLS